MQEISLHILDLVQNSITAGATLIRITMELKTAEDCLSFSLADNGKGMSEEMVERVTSPFTTTRTTRRVGLGIPLFKAGCEMTGGSFSITSKLGEGTELCGSYQASHIDRPPVGDYTGTVHSILVCNPGIDFVVTIKKDGEEFVCDTRQLKEVLGESVELSQPEVSVWLKEYLEEGYEEIIGGVYL